MFEQDYMVAAVVTLITVVIAVMLHYEAFILLGRTVEKSVISHRRRMLVLIFGLLFVHILAIWIFGISAWWLVELNSIGALVGYENLAFVDYIFMSAVTYTTLGYGDMIPMGPIRFLYGTQALVGFVLITWSASWTFLEMQKNWNKPDRHK